MSLKPEKVNVRGVRFDKVTMDSAFDAAVSLLETDGFDCVFTPNSEIVQMCVDDPSLYPVINSASLIIPDGIGVVYASKILGRPLPQKVAGCDLSRKLLAYAAETGKRVFLFGSAPAREGQTAVCDLAAENMKRQFPGLTVCGTHDGYFKPEETGEILRQINEADTDLLFVCLGAPKQEKWIFENRDALRCSLALGLGGSLDVYAGTVKRAPALFIKLNLEWFYRLLKQPSRIGRMMNLPRFLFGTLFYKLSGKDRKDNRRES